MSDDNMNTTETISTNTTSRTNAQYLSVLLNTSPAVLAGFAAIIASFAGLQIYVVESILFTGIIGMVLILRFDRTMVLKDLRRELDKHTDITFELYNEIKREDQRIQANIFNGLQYVKFIKEDAKDPLEAATRACINDVVFKAFTPSIVNNHHCAEIMSYKEPVAYLTNKRRVVLQLLNLSFTSKHIAIIEAKLPQDTTLSGAVKSYIYEVFREVISEELIEGCRRKIKLYTDYIEKNQDSPHFVEQITKIRQKNEGYIAMLVGMLLDSNISHASVTDRQTDSSITDKESQSIYQQVKAENCDFERQNVRPDIIVPSDNGSAV
jgi:hypothetical protein